MPLTGDDDRRIPNLYIAGAAKAGSTTLWSALREHPDVHAPVWKELHFMAADLDLPPDMCVRDREGYLGLYSEGTGHRYRLDASPTSMLSPGGAARIASWCPRAEILILLRDPVETIPAIHDQLVGAGRAKSTDLGRAVRHARSMKGESLVGLGAEAFRRYLDVVDYAPQVQRFYDHFPRDQVRVVLLEEVRVDPLGVWKGLLDHLDLPFVPADLSPKNGARRPKSPGVQRLIRAAREHVSIPRSLAPRLRSVRRAVVRANTQVAPRPPMDPALRAQLVTELRPRVRELAEVLARSLDTWAQDAG